MRVGTPSCGDKSPLEIVRWAVAESDGRAVVSTNFRPYEAAVLHLCTQVQPDMPVLWVDHGYNRPATYRHAEELKRRLNLNLKSYLPRMTAAHRDAIYGPVPTPDDEDALKEFSAMMKLEPFQRGMRELAPKVWITALRKVQNPNRAGLDIVSEDSDFGTIKVSPVFLLDRCGDGGLPARAINCRMSGTILIRRKRMKNASAACMPRGAAKRWTGQRRSWWRAKGTK